MRTQESLIGIEMHVSYRVPDSWKCGTGAKAEPFLDTQSHLAVVYCR